MALKVNNITVVDDTRNLVNVNTASFTGNTSIKLPIGTTAQRPVSNQAGMIRYNTDNWGLEVCSSDWYNIVDSRPLDINTKPTLLLDFVNSRSLDPRITFSRSSIGSYYNDRGVLKIAKDNIPRFDYDPSNLESKGLLIEPTRTNYLSYSGQFTANSSAWVNSYIGDCSVDMTYNKTPDGHYLSERLTILSTANALKGIDQLNIPTSAANSNVTFSIYVKPDNHNYIAITAYNTGNSQNYVAGYYDLSLGLAGNTKTGNGVSYLSSITNVGNGWYRCSMSGKPDPNTSNGVRVGIYLTSGFNLTTTFVGTIGTGVNIFGPQLEQDIYMSSYTPSTDTFVSRNSIGTFIGSNGNIQIASNNVARYNYNPLDLSLDPKLILEDTSTNSIAASEFPPTSWTASGNATLTSNNAVSPTGSTTAMKIQNNSTANTTCLAYRAHSGSFVSGSIYCFSCYFKRGSKQFNYMQLSTGPFTGNPIVFFDLVNESISYSENVISKGMIPAGNGWYRCWMTCLCISNVFGNFIIGITSNPSTSSHDGVVGEYNLLWGAQVEKDKTYPTSFIPTAGVSLTRQADISTSDKTTRAEDNALISGTNFSSWYNQEEGTISVDSIMYGTENSAFSVPASVLSISIGNSNDRMDLFRNIGNNVNGGSFYVIKNAYTVSVGDPTTINIGTSRLCVMAYKANNVGYVVSNATSVTANTNVEIPFVDRMYICDGYNGGARKGIGHIAKIEYYPKRLSNNEIFLLSRV
jgi:hypothetical protein